MNVNEEINSWTDELIVAGDQVAETVEKLFKNVNFHRLLVKNAAGETVANIPAALGVGGALLLIHVTVMVVVVSSIGHIFGLEPLMYKIEIVREEPVADDSPEVEETPVEDVTPVADEPPVAEQIVVGETVNVMEEVEVEEVVPVVVVEPDDLRKVKGIGPKYAAILSDAGITTYQALAEQNIDGLTAIIEASGAKLLKGVDSWPQQAAVAATGDWDALTKLQDSL